MSAGPRVLHVITSLAVGGAQRHLLSLLPGLGAPRTQDLIYFRDHDLRPAFETLVRRVRHLPMAGRAGPLLVPALAAAIGSGSYDIVHTHLLRADIYGALAARTAGVGRVVATKHNLEHRLERWHWRRVHGAAAQLVDRTVCISQAVGAWAVRRAGVPPASVRVVPYGIDPAPYAAADRTGARARLGLRDADRVVLCVARLDPQKNHSLLLHAFAAVRQAVPQARLLLAGAPQLGRPEYAEALHGLARRLELGSSVQWLGVRRDVPDLLAAADVVTLASEWEGFGLTLLEAMAAARPVVATRVGAVEEVVEHGATGLLVPPRDPAALAESLTAVLRDLDRCAALGRAGARRAEASFGVERMRAATRAIYAELMSGGA